MYKIIYQIKWDLFFFRLRLEHVIQSLGVLYQIKRKALYGQQVIRPRVPPPVTCLLSVTGFFVGFHEVLYKKLFLWNLSTESGFHENRRNDSHTLLRHRKWIYTGPFHTSWTVRAKASKKTACKPLQWKTYFTQGLKNIFYIPSQIWIKSGARNVSNFLLFQRFVKLGAVETLRYLWA